MPVRSQEEVRRILTEGRYAPASIVAIMAILSAGVAPAQVIPPGEPIAMPSDLPQHVLPANITDSGFKFGSSSEKELVGVHPRLVECARLALKYSGIDFVVFDGIRSLAEQRHYVTIGTSQTMDSMHLPQADHKGHAVDLVPYMNGKPTWDWNGCYLIACAMDKAATELGVAQHIRWGGAWDKRLSDFGGDARAYARETQAYQQRHAGKDFIDGPHFEWRD